MISAIQFGNAEKYVSEATIFTVDEAKKAAKVAQEAVRKDSEAMKSVVKYLYTNPHINIPNINSGKMLSERAAKAYEESYALSHGNLSPSAKL